MSPLETITTFAHCLQLQSHGMFMVFATGKEKTLDTFFRNKYVKPASGTTTIANRPGKPGYRLGIDPPRDSLMRLVFEAMGSTPNPVDFVLCEQQINSLKARVWLGDVGTEADLSGNITEDTIIVASERVTSDKRVSNSEGTIARLETITNGEVNNIARLKASLIQQFSPWF